MMNNTTDALTVTCPKCHAEPGIRCTTKTGTWSPAHTDRTKAAVEAAAKKRTKRTCASCGVRLTKANNDPANHANVCDTCFDQAGYENDHVDGNHEDGAEMDRCPTCNPDIVPTHTTKPWTSHADCDHEKTKAARAACRRERAKADLIVAEASRAIGIA